MSTQPDADHDVDRTDELPALDVEAHEAQLAAEQDDTLASTDARAVTGLREAEDLHYDDSATLRFPRPRPKAPELTKTSDVTIEATRILGRIRELESKLASTKTRESELRARVELAAQELGVRDKEKQALKADNERLAEQRSIVVERVHALEQQLQDEATQFERDLAQLQQQVASEERNSAQLARHLAAKIAEHASMSQEIARRDATINALTAVRDELSTQLDEMRRNDATLEGERADRIRGLERALERSERERLEAQEARDASMERLRAELQLSQDERAIIAGQLEKSRARNRSMAREIFARDNEIASLKADLAVHVEALAAIRQDVNRAAMAAPSEHPDRVLEPVEHDGDVIVLDKKMMTIGRTSDNDICIPSKLVSRNHARLLVGPNAVIIEDADSTNGCLVNDVPVKQQLMRDGDVLAIGDLKYRLRTRSDTATRARDNVIAFGQ